MLAQTHGQAELTADLPMEPTPMETTAHDTLRLVLRLGSDGTILDYSALSYFASSSPLFTAPQTDIIGAVAAAVLTPAIARTIAHGAVMVLMEGTARTYLGSRQIGGSTQWLVTTISPTAGHEVLVVVREVTDRRMRQLDMHTAASQLEATSDG